MMLSKRVQRIQYAVFGFLARIPALRAILRFFLVLVPMARVVGPNESSKGVLR